MKQGSKFKLTTSGKTITGHIYVKDKDTLYLCQNANEWDGADAPNKLGYTNSWVVNKGDYLFDIIKVDETDIRNPKDFIPMELVGYSIKKTSKTVTFGCGAVRLPIAEVKTFAKILNSPDGKVLKKILNIMSKYSSSISDNDIVTLKKLFL